MKQVKNVRDYNLQNKDGVPIRKATLVEFTDGTIIKFTERMGKDEAIRNAMREVGKNLSSLRDRIALAAVKRELSIKVGDKVNTRNGVGVVKVIDSSSYSITMLDVLLTEGKDKGERIYIPESGAEKV